MKRHLCLWFPNWPIQCLKAARPELRNRPLVLVRQFRGREVAAACCRAAQAAGVRPGLPVAEARALFGGSAALRTTPQFLSDDPPANRRALQRLAWDCEAFSPLVGLEEGEFPASLLLEISSSAGSFGGERPLAEQLSASMQERRFQVCLGVADTIGAAWAAARFRTKSQAAAIVPPAQHQQALQSLPIEALRLPHETVDKLHELNIRRVSQALALPRKSLPSRFGKELLLRIDQALGRRDESILPERRPQPVRQAWEGESPLQATAALDAVVAALLGKIMHQLDERGAGVLGLAVELLGAARPAQLSLALLRPTRDVRHVMNLLRLQWEQLVFPEGVARVQIEVSESAALPAEQHQLWEAGDRGRQAGVDALIERLSSRLGSNAVLRPVLRDEHQPELAYRLEARIARCGEPDVVAPAGGPGDSRCRLCRPLWLMQTPTSVQVVSVVPDGPPYQLSWQGGKYLVARCWGPERITTGWWRGEHVRRDYYHVETAEGYRLWVFRDWTQGGWFLHAVFD